MELVLSLRDGEEEEENDFGLLSPSRASTDTQNTSISMGVDTALTRIEEDGERTSTQVPEPLETKDLLPRGKDTVEEAADAGELSWYKAKVQRLIEERDALKLLGGQREGEVKRLQAELEVSRKEQTELIEQVQKIFGFNEIDSELRANNSVLHVEQKFEVIRQLRAEVDVVKSEAEEWKKNMDHLASEKETARTQLASAEVQLRSLKEKTLVQAKNIEEF
ncbi:uncharacterized protein [Nicotiana tomentosiformis]|uniref:uncharacterized protein n=1 Tax=Nicotiana tomentosiformis TaxID=4098 RepID=UPI00388CC121